MNLNYFGYEFKTYKMYSIKYLKQYQMSRKQLKHTMGATSFCESDCYRIVGPHGDLKACIQMCKDIL